MALNLLAEAERARGNPTKVGKVNRRLDKLLARLAGEMDRSWEDMPAKIVINVTVQARPV